ncbi:D-alanyl-D-alanine carboxypeptidase [Streptomyces sp. NPDC046821]|uniref:D-alanyl-D-alanine carboxypeptidase n=1 Tax=Streptomyces sp. NPDC046821 TaxID=3154702 RepID=UPI0033DB2A6A
MAGTPDRSEQQESSGGGAPEERDPRLAMAMKSPERADQATAVFSVRDVPTAGADSGPAEESDSAGPDSVVSDSGEASAEGSVAVSEDSESGSETQSGAGSVSESRSDSDSGADAGAESGEGSEAAADADAGSGEEPGDARLRAAVAAWVAGPRDGSADDATPETAEGAEGSEEREAEGEQDEAPAAEDEPEASDASEKAEPADAKPEAEASDASEEPADDAEPADAKPEVEAKADAKPEADDKADADEEADAEAKTDAKSDADDEADADPKADADAKPEDKGDAEPKADAKPDADDKADAEPEADADAKADAKPPVDQATAVFKAVKPPVKPPVDQPTQMLKASDVKASGADAKAEAKADAKASASTDAKPSADPKTSPKPDPESERASKFVPLKKAHLGGSGSAPEAAAAEPERTTQQPLPPRPPLDLLAELTNTPPPPETRVRTAVRRVKIWTPVVVLLAIVFAVVQAVRPLPTPTLALTAKPTFTFDGSKVSLPWPGEGQGWMDVSGIGSMDHFGAQKPVPIGSVAKAMTAYVVLKDHPMKPGADGLSITVDATAEKEGGFDSAGESTLNTVKAGDKLSQKDALSAIMIPSANNIARLLARWDAGSEEAFVKKMNAAAKDLGMTGTTYTDPSGLKETTVSTAHDQVLLGNELVKIPALMAITKLPTWKDPSGKVWQNFNRLVPYNNAIGVKTGSTTKAGGNLLFAATKDAGGETVTVVGAVLGQHKPSIIDTVNAVSKTAMLAAQDAVKASSILKQGDVVGYVDDGLGGQTPIVVDKNVSAVGWAGLTVKLELTDGATAIPHQAKAGTKVGVLKVGDGAGGAVEVPVSLQKNLAEPGFGAKLTRVG